MAIRVRRGSAQAVAKIQRFTPANVEAGDTFHLQVGDKKISYTAAAASVADVVAGLVAAAAEVDFPEWEGLTVSAGGSNEYILVEGEAGVDWEMTASTGEGGATGIEVTRLRAGSPQQNEIQRITLPANTGGTWALTADEDTASGLAAAITAANLEASLESLAGIGLGGVSVSGDDGGPYDVEFIGGFAGVNVPLMTADGSGLTGAAIYSVETLQDGAPSQNAIHLLTETDGDYNVVLIASTLEAATLTALGLQLNGSGTGFWPSESTALTIQEAINDMYRDTSGDPVIVCEVSGTGGGNPSNGTSPYTIEWVNQLGLHAWPAEVAGDDEQPLSFANIQLLDGGTADPEDYFSVSEIQPGLPTGLNEIQRVRAQPNGTAGTWTHTFRGEEVSGLDHDIATAALQTALEGNPEIGAGNVAVSGVVGAWIIEYQGARAGQDLPEATVDDSGITGGVISVLTTQAAAAAVNERQRIALTGQVGGGTFDLSQDYGSGAEGISAIASNATGATITTGFDGLATPVAGDVLVTGAAGGPWVVDFAQNFAGTAMNLIVADGTNLTGASAQTLASQVDQASAGPNHWGGTGNWEDETGTLAADPANADDVIVPASVPDILYDLGQSSITLDSLRIDLGAGRIGLPRWNAGGYREHLRQYLEIGATSVQIGTGAGNELQRVKLNFGSVQTTVEVLTSGSGTEPGIPAVQLVGTHASNTLTVIAGSVGLAVHPGETSTFQVSVYGGDVLFGAGTAKNVLTRGGTFRTGEGVTFDGTHSLTA